MTTISLVAGSRMTPLPGSSALSNMTGTALSEFFISLLPLHPLTRSPRHRNKIRDWHLDFLVTANSWPHFLYENNHYDSSEPAKGLFKGSILLKGFKLIFTSPTSVDADENQLIVSNVLAKCHRGERRTCPTVANLLKMKRVTPQAIVYIVVQVSLTLLVNIKMTIIIGAIHIV
ncbi:hypothetical protein J3R83DRAFT_8848 [Lanmaoa asiatica]|nr:hypothetical protein J3R83DRAFT_8848 [Lanmaoa asiatica]